MVREFSEEKRDEIFIMLDIIDHKEWESFKGWSKRKALDCGDWAERLEINKHTEYVDKYHQEVLDINDRTREQVNAVFEHVAEIDTEYAGRMRECQEEIKEQIATVQTMIEFMRSMNGGNTNIAILDEGNVSGDRIKLSKDVYGEEGGWTHLKPEEELEIKDMRNKLEGQLTEGQSLLIQCLKDHGVTVQSEINSVLEWIMEDDYKLILDLVNAHYNGNYNGQDVEAIYETIMRNYDDNQLRMAREFFLEYVAGSEYTGLYDWGEVVLILQMLNPQRLMNLYKTQGDQGKEAVFNSLIEIYNGYRIEEAAKIFTDYMENNGITDPSEQELIIATLRLFHTDSFISLSGADESEQAAACESLIELYNNENRRGHIFYAYTWLQINRIERFPHSAVVDEDTGRIVDYDKLVEDFVTAYKENEFMYLPISKATQIPPEVIAVIHYRENSADFFNGTFQVNLSDGTKLNRTISQKEFWRLAVAAIQSQQSNIEKYELLSETTDIVTMMCFIESYNGLGYYDHHRICPYSYSGTDIYVSGKYLEDENGKSYYSPDTVDEQIGSYRLLLAIIAGTQNVQYGRSYINRECVGGVE